MALFAYNRKALSKKLRYYDVMLTAYIVGVGVYFMFSTSLLVVLSRGSLYFNALEPLLLASQVHLLTQRSSRFVMANAVCVLSFASFFQSISPYPDAFVPYKGLTINTEYSRGYVFYNH